jgi:hypothetical protein
MQLGKTLIGAIIGAALGIALLVVVFLMFHIDRVWLAIPVALLTGLGVRMLVSTSGHASYLRGAITAVLALLAYLGGWSVVAQVAQMQAKKPSSDLARPSVAAEADDAEGEGADAAAAAVPTPPPITERPLASAAGNQRPAMPRGFSTFDYIWLCVAGLIAYELGRGTGAAPTPAPTTEPEPTGAPAGAHPDA